MKSLPALLLAASSTVPMVFVVAGCGGADCESLCEEAQSCEGSQGLSGDDCAAECGEAEDLADDADCGSEFDDYLDCIADAPDVCNIDENECQSEGIAYAFCVLAYCQDNRNAPGCEGAGGGGCSSYGIGGGESGCVVGETCGEGPENELDCDADMCVCRVDGEEVASVPYEAKYCDGELEDQVAAASSACGW